MELGDRVVYYTHEASDADHRTVDCLALVTGVVDDHTVDVVAFPPGGPVCFYRVSEFDPDGYNDVVGLSYYRGVGEDPPDFEQAFRHVNELEWIDMVNRQRREREQARAIDLDDIQDRHDKEREQLSAELDRERGPGSPQPQVRPAQGDFLEEPNPSTGPIRRL